MYRIKNDANGKPELIVRVFDNARIPVDVNNGDYREYLDWLTAGNIPGLLDSAPRATSIKADSNIIIGDGVDEIILAVCGEPNALATINTLCGGTAGSLDIQLDADGNGSQAFSCDTSPTVITFSFGEATCKVRAL